MQTGLIIKIISEFALVETDNKLYKCKAKGTLRYQKITPTVGDYVEILILNEIQLIGQINKILPRKNLLVRPRIANVDQALLVCSLAEPQFSHFLLNKFLNYAIIFNIKPLIVFTKYDLLNESEFLNLKKLYLNWYDKIGYKFFFINNLNYNNDVHYQLINLFNELDHKLTVVMGQTGVGKSSFLNRLFEKTDLIKTQAISKALNRGKHTTTAVQFYNYNQGKIADTPGFSAFNFNFSVQLISENWPGFFNYLGQCQFRSCLHRFEKNCAIKKAVLEFHFPEFIYKDYLKALLEIRK